MKRQFKVRVLVALATLWFGLPGLPAAQGTGRTRLKREKPGLQRMAADYYAKKYHVSRREAEHRIAIQDRAAGIDDELTKVLGEQFAGIWYDHDDRGRLKIGMTREGMSKASEVGGILKRYGVAGSADLAPVKFTLADIQRRQDDARNLIMDMVESGHAQTSYSTKINQVVVTAIAKLPEQEEVRLKDLAAREGVSVRRVDIPTLQLKLDFCTTAACDPPLRGGLKIFTPLGFARALLWPVVGKLTISSP